MGFNGKSQTVFQIFFYFLKFINFKLQSAHCIHSNAVYFDVYTGIVNVTGPASWETRVQHSNIHIHPEFIENSAKHNIAMMNLVDAPDDLLSYPYTGMIQLPTEAVNLVDMIGSIVSNNSYVNIL